ncbi:MAG: hypothetical protein ABI352_02900 [Candidatus Dormibacter sp.]
MPGALLVRVRADEAVAVGFRVLAAGRGADGCSASGSSESATDSSTRPTAAAAAVRLAAASRTAAAKSRVSYMPPTVAGAFVALRRLNTTPGA